MRIPAHLGLRNRAPAKHIIGLLFCALFRGARGVLFRGALLRAALFRGAPILDHVFRRCMPRVDQLRALLAAQLGALGVPQLGALGVPQLGVPQLGALGVPQLGVSALATPRATPQESRPFPPVHPFAAVLLLLRVMSARETSKRRRASASCGVKAVAASASCGVKAVATLATDISEEGVPKSEVEVEEGARSSKVEEGARSSKSRCKGSARVTFAADVKPFDGPWPATRLLDAVVHAYFVARTVRTSRDLLQQVPAVASRHSPPDVIAALVRAVHQVCERLVELEKEKEREQEKEAQTSATDGKQQGAKEAGKKKGAKEAGKKKGAKEAGKMKGAEEAEIRVPICLFGGGRGLQVTPRCIPFLQNMCALVQAAHTLK